MRKLLLAMALFGAMLAQADVSNCACDPAKPETMKRRECSLCGEAERHPVDAPHFFLKDINPRKPNRWLILPRVHGEGGHPLDALPDKERTEFWTAAIQKARELWGDEWGLAYNGDAVRTQCHGHAHIGRLLKGLEGGRFLVVNGPAGIPKSKGKGIWIHPHGKKLHVHLEENITETVLLR